MTQNHESFIQEILEQAKACNQVAVAKQELDILEQSGHFDHLVLIKQYIDVLKESSIPYLIHGYGVRLTLLYLLGVQIDDLTQYGYSSNYYLVTNNISPRIDVEIAREDLEEALHLARSIFGEIKEANHTGAYQIGRTSFIFHILVEPILDQYKKAIALIHPHVNPLLKTSLSHMELDQETVLYMLEEDDKGYEMPHLNGCLTMIPSEFYEILEVAKPKNLYELAITYNLYKSMFYSKEELFEAIKSNGICGVIYDFEVLYDILALRYDVPESMVKKLVTRQRLGNLSEGDELSLSSYDVPEYMIKQIKNINYLHALPESIGRIRVAYELARVKRLETSEFERIIKLPYPNSYVGPFFVIQGELYPYKDSLDQYNGNTRFFDAPMSHFEFFDTLGIDGDYGNYPRGRVIYDNFHKRFIVYMDVSLFIKNIKGRILDAYHIEKKQVSFLKDSHYKHDGL